MRTCTRCLRPKPDDQFSPNFSYCDPCRQELVRIWQLDQAARRVLGLDAEPDKDEKR